MAHVDKISEFESGAAQFIERIDSGLTNESPFGSTLTTPIDENVDLFSEMKTRLLPMEQIVISDPDGQQLGPFDADEIGLNIAEKNTPWLYSDEIKRATIPPSIYPRASLDTEVTDHEPRDEKLEVNPKLSSEAEQHVLGLEHELGELYDINTDDENGTSPTRKASNVTNETLLLLSELPFSTSHLPSQVVAEESDLDPVMLAFSTLTATSLLQNTFRLISFVPWCVLVGGAILLFPGHLDFVVFRSGYVRPSPPGIRRFKHWADTGMHFVGIFLGFMFSLWWIIPRFGLAVITCVTARTAYTWGNFAFRRKRVIKLGQNDQESLWLTWKLHNGYTFKIEEGRRGWYFTSRM